MKMLKKIAVLGSATLFGLAVSACAPEVGSPEWCQTMKEKPKGDWSANEAADFTKHCIM
ncbi:MAG: DUF3012 domain-containing protein [Alphaproteobacteria bacterium]|nr:DUF3012 domain-containing protein [Alphaproteobacteria bacterium]